jgi:hypothetical protein
MIEPGDDREVFGDEHEFDPAQDPEDEIEVGEEPGEYAFLLMRVALPTPS